jgi:hypothetical protein
LPSAALLSIRQFSLISELLTCYHTDIEQDDALFLENAEAFHAEEWFLRFPCEFIKDKKLPAEYNGDVHSLTTQELKSLFSPKRQLRSAEAIGKNKSPRRLSHIGTQKSLIVIVNGKDVVNPFSIADAESFLYDTTNDQFKDCSNNAMEIVKKENTVVINLPNNLATYDDDNIGDAVFPLICAAKGLASGCHITKELGLDHVLFSLPFGLANDSPNSYWAFASAGGDLRYSVYNGGTWRFSNGSTSNGGFFIPAVLMHE